MSLKTGLFYSEFCKNEQKFNLIFSLFWFINWSKGMIRWYISHYQISVELHVKNTCSRAYIMCVGIKRIAPAFMFKPRDLVQIHIQQPVVLCIRPVSSKCRLIVMNIYKWYFTFSFNLLEKVHFLTSVGSVIESMSKHLSLIIY